MKRKVLSGIMNLLVGIVAGFLAIIFLKQGIARIFSYGVADYLGFLIPTSTFLLAGLYRGMKSLVAPWLTVILLNFFYIAIMGSVLFTFSDELKEFPVPLITVLFSLLGFYLGRQWQTIAVKRRLFLSIVPLLAINAPLIVFTSEINEFKR